MSINSIGSISSTTTSTSTSDENKLIKNYETFLNLLTTQLKNQNPLSPLDTKDFMGQLTQFTSVEQQVKQNANLEKLLAATLNQQSSNIIGYIGKTVTSNSNEAQLNNNKASWGYNAKDNAPNSEVVIKDTKGKTIFSGKANLKKGTNTYTWNGRTNEGKTAPTGTYTLSINGKAASGQGINIQTGVSGKVDRVDLNGSDPILYIGSVAIKLSSIQTVSA